MTDAQLATIVAFIATFGAGLFTFIRWAVAQWREERKADRDERREVRADERADRASDREAQRENTRALVELGGLMRGLDGKLTSLNDTWETRSGVHDVEDLRPERPDDSPRKRTRTPRGVSTVGGG